MNLLFFTPHAALWPHTQPEAYIARALAEYGHKIFYLTCGKVQTYCAPMSAKGLAPGCTAEESARVCSDCKAAANAIARVYGFPVDSLVHYLSVEDFSKFELIASEAVASKSVDTDYLGVNVGRLALYEFTLAHKKMSIELDELQWKEYQCYLVNALRTLQGFARYLEKKRPNAILTFSPQYSNINSVMQFAIRQGVKVFFIESGTNLAHRLGTMRVWDWDVHGLVNPALMYWERSELNPVSQYSADNVIAHFSQLLAGHQFSVYSSPYKEVVNMRQLWNIMPAQKVLLMTLSSYDEAYAAFLIGGFPHKKVFSDVFNSQAEWIKATMEWVANRPDIFLVIRVHPRDFPNKRESVRSEQSFMLQALLEHLPNNVHVNWPSEAISLYALLEYTDVVLTGWSVTGIEALTLGIPVVTYDANLPSYPGDIHYTGRSTLEYFANIDRALADGWNFENVINGFRWFAYNFDTCTVTVSRVLGKSARAQLPRVLRIWQKVIGRLPTLRFSIELLKWKPALTDVNILSAMLENGHDALPPALKAQGRLPVLNDRKTVGRSLLRLHDLLYAERNMAVHTHTLSRNIRDFLKSEGLQ